MKKIDIEKSYKISILGGGNIGTAIAQGLASSGWCSADKIIITRRNIQLLAPLANAGFVTHSDNSWASKQTKIIFLTVQPQQLDSLINEIRPIITKDHILISVVTGVTIATLQKKFGNQATIIRAMPNTAIAIRESMTCLSAEEGKEEALQTVQSLFAAVGETLVISENHMVPATALTACGVAFFLRSIRAASQGGIEIGFHSDEALLLAAQTARGAAALVLSSGGHPESEIDHVTTPRGCTIAGLNEMEHRGFSSAMIKGITTSAEMAETLYLDRE
ncbi:MAG: pyrroline-5-carboxylate reductase [Fidelibacterota bacterium]